MVSSGIVAARSILRFTNGTFSRGSEASFITEGGQKIVWANSDSLRQEDRGDGNGAIYLTEGSRTNLMPESEDLSQWNTQSGISVTGGQTAPDQEADAYRVEETSGGNPIIESPNMTVSSSGVTLVASVWIKKDNDTSRFPAFSLHTLSNNDDVWIGLNTSDGGTWNAFTQGGWTVVSFGASEDVSGWWRVYLVATHSTDTSMRFRFTSAFSSTEGSSSFDGGATGSAIAWGFQLEEGSYPSSYIRTNGASATRAADDLSFASIPQRMRSGRWAFDFYPYGSSAESSSAGEFYSNGGSNDEYRLRGDDQVGLQLDNTSHIRSSTLTWSRHQKITVIWDGDAGTMEVSGADSGNGTSSATAWSLDDTSYQVGARPDLSVPFFGRLSEPRRA